MTLDELLSMARLVRATPWARLPAHVSTDLAIGVINMLTSSAHVRCDLRIHVDGIEQSTATPEELRAVAVAILRAIGDAT